MSAQRPEEKIAETVTEAFIRTKTRAEDQELLDRRISWGEDLADSTYAEWIEERARKLFLILVEIGAPERIFDILDDAFDDDDLPLTSQDTARLNLSELNRELSHAQAQLLPKMSSYKEPGVGAQLKLAIEVISSSRSVFSKSSGDDRVRIVGSPSKIFFRRRVVFDRAPLNVSKEDFLQDVIQIKRSSYRHIVNLRTAYLGDNCGYVLLSPTLDFPIRTFFSNVPKSFKGLPPQKQQEALLNWPHCLACTLYHLHKQGESHGNISPSNIFVDPLNKIHLGFSAQSQSIQSQQRDGGSEVNEYRPPERWVRASVTRSGAVITPPLPPPRSPLPARPSFSSQNGSKRAVLPSPRSKRFPYSRSNSGSSASRSVRSNQSNASTLCLVSSSESVSSRPSLSPSSIYSNHVQDDDPKELRLSNNSNEASMMQPQLEDLRPGDVFSLACFTLDVVTFMVRGRLAASPPWGRRSERGGGSFHANPAAVSAFIDGLEAMAASRTEQVFQGVAPLLSIVRSMLHLDPEARPPMIEVLRRMDDALVQSSGLSYLHCGGGGQC